MMLEPAKRLGLETSKGVIAVGADADLTIFNPETIIDGATFGDLDTPPQGIDYVIVDGKIAMKDNTFVDERLGMFINFKER